MAFHALEVKHAESLIDGNAKMLALAIPADLHWQAGQHITLRFALDGEEHRRSYSICNPPGADTLNVTVKRVKGGLVSNHINDNIGVGDRVDVMEPFGGFCLNPDAKQRRTYYFFAAGSGITPLFAMLQAVLADEPHSAVCLIYGNQTQKTIVFKDELDRLMQQYPTRLTCLHVLSDASWFSGLTPWRSGRIDQDAVATLFDEHPPYAQDTQYYICGPGAMNRTVSDILRGLDVPQTRIHSESYGEATATDNTINGVDAIATISLSGKTHKINITAAQTVLEAVLAAGLEPPFSCQSGICGACQAQCEKGAVAMRTRMALDDDEIKKGAVLTCQSVATTPEIKIVY